VALQHRKSGGGGGIAVVEENIGGSKIEEDKGLVHAPPSPPGGKAMPPPPLPDSKNMAWDYFFMDMNMARASLNEEDEIENEEGEIEGENVDDNGGHVEDEIEPKTPEKVEVDVYNKEHDHEDDDVIREAKHIEHSQTAPAEFRRAIKVVPTVTLMQILGSLDDHFLKASETAQEVSKMLEATRLHYHSNFADNRGNVFCIRSVSFYFFQFKFMFVVLTKVVVFDIGENCSQMRSQLRGHIKNTRCHGPNCGPKPLFKVFS
jgi:hypothetical protein